MTPDVEAIAIRVAAQFLAGHHCNTCGKQWLTGLSTKVLFHKCSPPAQRSWWSDPLDDMTRDRESWARNLLGPLADAIEERDGAEALLRGDE